MKIFRVLFFCCLAISLSGCVVPLIVNDIVDSVQNGEKIDEYQLTESHATNFNNVDSIVVSYINNGKEQINHLGNQKNAIRFCEVYDDSKSNWQFDEIKTMPACFVSHYGVGKKVFVVINQHQQKTDFKKSIFTITFSDSEQHVFYQLSDIQSTAQDSIDQAVELTNLMILMSHNEV
jgi:hypothetical protein